MKDKKMNILTIKTSEDVKGRPCTARSLELYVGDIKIDRVTSVSLGNVDNNRTIKPESMVEATITVEVNLG